MPILLQACLAFLKIGAFSFGGGYAVLAFIQKEIVEVRGWIDPDSFVNMVAIAEMTPGPIAVNSSTFVGYRLGGIPGGVICSLSTLLIPFLLALLASVFFTRFKDSRLLRGALNGIRPMVIGLIAAACLSIAEISFSGLESLLFFGLALLMVWKFKVNPILVLVSCGVLGAGYYGLIAPLLS